MNAKVTLMAFLAVILASVCIISVDASEGYESGLELTSVEWDPITDCVTFEGQSSTTLVIMYVTGQGYTSQYAAFDVSDGHFSGMINLGSADPGQYALVAFTDKANEVRKSFEITPDVGIDFGSEGESVVYIGHSRYLSATVPDSYNGREFIATSSNSAVLKVISVTCADGTLKVGIEGLKEGSVSLVVYSKENNSLRTTIQLKVEKEIVPQESKQYSFFIQITKDFDKASYGAYSESDLRTGITISAQGYDAAEALMKACAAKGIDCSMNSDPNDTYYGWILSLFGLKQYQSPGDTSVWTYWVQYHNGSYNQWTLGHYTDGGSFRLIWKSTDEGGSDVDVPPDKPSSSETTTNPDGSTTTTTTTTEKDDSGNTTEKVESTTTNKDGSTSSTVTETMKDASGNITSVTESTSTTSKGDDGSKVTETMSTTTTSSGVTSESSKVTEKETEDGSEVRTESTSTVKDASGNVTETKETVTEVITTSDSVTEITSTETVRNGVTERTESAVFEYGDGAITSKVENTLGSDGKAKSTSVTIIDVSDGQLTADQAKIAVDGTEGAIDRLPTAPASVEKVVEVRSVDASVSVDPKALETLSGFGSGLRIVGDDGSIHVDGDVCNSLSGKPSAVTFSMNADAKDSLNDKQKQVVGDSRFIDLSAKVGDERIHQLGGTATVTFGYTPSATDDVSRLCVYYVDENGDRFMVTSSFDRDTDTFTIEVDHFSIFMVGTAEESADGGFPTSAVAIVIVVAILAVVGAVVYHSRRS